MPKITVVAVWASRKDENTQEYRWRSPRLAAIRGMAVATMVASMAITNSAAMMAAVTKGRRIGVMDGR